MKSNSILEMQNAIKNYINRNLPKDKNQAVIGRVRGGRVLVGNKSYRYSTAVDTAIFDDLNVYCLVSGNDAAIVGTA